MPKSEEIDVTVFVRDEIASWPEEHAAPGERQKVAPTVRVMSLADALTRRHLDDAHYVAYRNMLGMRLCSAIHSPEQRAAALERRALREEVKQAALKADYIVEMVAFVADVDDIDAHALKAPARDEWRRIEHDKVTALLAAHQSGFVYDTRGGYRIVYLLPQPFNISGDEDRQRWKIHYKLLCVSLARRFGIVADPSCADWTRCYRAPCVMRKRPDGVVAREERPSTGDPRAIADFIYTPVEADYNEARQRAETDKRWRIDQDSGETQRGYTRAGGGLQWDLDDPAVRAAVEAVVKNFPRIGRRDDLAKALAGMLWRAGAVEDDAHELLLEMFTRGGSTNPRARLTIVAKTFACDDPDAQIMGYPTAAEIIGEEAADVVKSRLADASNNAFLAPFSPRPTIAPRQPAITTIAPTQPKPVVEAPAPVAPPAVPPTVDEERVRKWWKRAVKRQVERFSKSEDVEIKEQARRRAVLFERILQNAILTDRACDGFSIGIAEDDIIEELGRALAQAVPTTKIPFETVLKAVEVSLARTGLTVDKTNIDKLEKRYRKALAAKADFIEKLAAQKSAEADRVAEKLDKAIRERHS